MTYGAIVCTYKDASITPSTVVTNVIFSASLGLNDFRVIARADMCGRVIRYDDPWELNSRHQTPGVMTPASDDPPHRGPHDVVEPPYVVGFDLPELLSVTAWRTSRLNADSSTSSPSRMSIA